jgi:hypothetical protein
MAFDNATDGGNNGGTTNSLSFNHLIVNGSGGLLIVSFLGDVITGSDDITSVTFNSVAMTLVQKWTGTGGVNANRFFYVYILANAPTGTHSVAISSTANHYLIGLAASYSSAATSGQPDASQVFTSSNSSPYATSLSSVADNCWMILCAGGSGEAASTGSTKRVVGSAFNEPGIFDSNGPIHPAGSYSMSTTSNSGTVNDVHIMLSIAPSGTVTVLHTLSLLGVGL